MDKVRIAIFGLNQGARIGDRLMQIPECEIVAVAGFGYQDTGKTAEEVAEGFGATLYADYNELLAKEKIDGVVNALPNKLHLPATKACAEAGIKTVLVEKPVATTVADAKEIVRIGEEYGMTILVGHHRRSASLFLALKEFLATGKLGTIVGVRSCYALSKNPRYWDDVWHTFPDGGPLLVNGIHDIDDLNNVLDMHPTKVYAAKRSTIRGNQAEDSCSALIEFEEGATATYFVTDGCPSPWNYDDLAHADERFWQYDGHDSINIFGSEGSIGFPSMTFYTYPGKSESEWGWKNPMTIEKFSDVEPNDALMSEAQHFVNLCNGTETKPRCTGEQGLRSVQIINAIIESADSGEVVHIK